MIWQDLNGMMQDIENIAKLSFHTSWIDNSRALKLF